MNITTQNNESPWRAVIIPIVLLPIGLFLHTLGNYWDGGDIFIIFISLAGLTIGVPLGLLGHFIYGYQRTIKIDWNQRKIAIEKHKLIWGSSWKYYNASQLQCIWQNTADGEITLMFKSGEICTMRSNSIDGANLTYEEKAIKLSEALSYKGHIKWYCEDGGGN